MRPLFELINHTIQSLSDKKAERIKRQTDITSLNTASHPIMAMHSADPSPRNRACFSLFPLPNPTLITVGPLQPEIESIKNEHRMTREEAVNIQKTISQLDRHPQRKDQSLITLTTKAFDLIAPTLQNIKHFDKADILHYNSERNCWVISDSLHEKLNQEQEKNILNILKSTRPDI